MQLCLMENHFQSRRIYSQEELIEFWPLVLDHIKTRIGVVAVAYLYDAIPVALDEAEVVLEFQKPFHLQKVVEASKRFAFEQVLNECLAAPHRLRFQLAR